MASRDEYADTAKAPGSRKDRASYMIEVDCGPMTLAEEKLMDPNSVGSGNDHAGVLSEVIRTNVRK